MSSFYGRHKLWVWAGVWLLTRGLMFTQIGFWNHTSVTSLEDVFIYEGWSEPLASDGTLPSGELWQYPPGAAFFLLIPRLAIDLKGFGPPFAGMMLVFDAIAFALIAFLARRQGRDTGVWIWLFGIPALRTVPLLRFDMVGTTFAVAALAVVHRRPAWFGALAGLGAMVKIWPIVVLFGEWNWRRLLRACLAAAVASALVFALSAFFFDGDLLEFLAEQGGRGLQVESVASLPWHLREIVTGEPPATLARFGTSEIASTPADVVADLLTLATLAVLVASAAWWAARTRAIQNGRDDLADPAVSRDFVFVVVLLLVVTSRVLSPQYFVWLLGLAAIALTSDKSRIARPAWILVAAAVLATAAYGHQGAWGGPPVYGSSFNMVLRDAMLLVASIDAVAGLVRRLTETPLLEPPDAAVSDETAIAAPATAPP
jgi:Glycosyltransferase family 87